MSTITDSASSAMTSSRRILAASPHGAHAGRPAAGVLQILVQIETRQPQRRREAEEHGPTRQRT